MVAFAEPACRPRLETLRDRVLRARRRCCPVDLSSPVAERVVYRGRAQPDRSIHGCGSTSTTTPSRPAHPAAPHAERPGYLPRRLLPGVVDRSTVFRLAKPAIGSSSRVGILSVLAVAPHAHATLGATTLHSCHGLLPLGASSSPVS